MWLLKDPVENWEKSRYFWFQISYIYQYDNVIKLIIIIICINIYSYIIKKKYLKNECNFYSPIRYCVIYKWYTYIM